jgi:hypothetical protein
MKPIIVTVVAGGLIASAYAQSDSKSPLDKFERTGETVNCVSMPTSDITPVDDRTFLVRTGASTFYVNETRGICRGASASFTRLELNLFGSSLCSGEIVKVVDNQTGMFRSTCTLGVFEKLKKKDAAASDPPTE